jgi:hypothetical protein
LQQVQQLVGQTMVVLALACFHAIRESTNRS